VLTEPVVGLDQTSWPRLDGKGETPRRELAPGGMRTDMFGLSMLAQPLAPDYERVTRPSFRASARAARDACPTAPL
jgi:hypothetical protein